ncbi:hypothetical protein [Phaeospirillum tilakii]|uniref:Uncharacterized protein n=1 Tax=Phaeospirillum tilakii TaxID=741673 RepID=A0ABW5CDX7_9PROT
MPEISFDGKYFWINRRWRFSEDYVSGVIRAVVASLRRDPRTRDKLAALAEETGLKQAIG